MKGLLLSIFAILLNSVSYGQSGFEYFNIGLVKYNLSDFEKAISDFDRAIEVNPEYSEAYNLRGASKFNLGDFTGAIEDYNRAIELDKKHVGGIRLTIYDQRGRKIESTEPVIGNAGMAVPYYNRALAREALEDFEGAIEDYTAALDIDPDLLRAYFFRGGLKHLTGDLYGACSDWRQAGELGVVEALDLLMDHCDPEPE
jgi:tetratricopeptide (TPR) repeat protein